MAGFIKKSTFRTNPDVVWRKKAMGNDQNDQVYRTWNQDDLAYNKEEAWPAALFPDSSYHLFSECGCLITSLAIMLRHYGIEKETDPTLFNPWILNQKLIRKGLFDSMANLHLYRIQEVYPLEYMDSIPFTWEDLRELCREGHPFLITVPGLRAERHFIVPDHLTDTDMAIIDCAWGKKYLSEFDTIHELRTFRRLGE
jgi:hypothetical protein